MIAPDFHLPDAVGKTHHLSDYRGSWVVLYFYPKDDTPGCTTEACSFRDTSADFARLGVIILGVSKDTVSSHKKFAEKYHLNFPVLSDPTHETIAAYQAWGPKKFMGREFFGTLRKTYLINPAGEIKKIYDRVNPLTHSSDILSDLKIFSSQ